MAFNLERKITWKELAPSLQSLFKSLQEQITANKNDITELMGRMDEAEDRLDIVEDNIVSIQNNIKYLMSISQEATITGEQDGYPILITTINMADGKQLIQENFAVRHDTLKRCEGGKTPEGGFTVVFPEPVDRIIGIQMNDTWIGYSSDGGRGIGYVDGDNWMRTDKITGSGVVINYDSVHETNDPHTFLFFFTLYGYKLTGEVPELPEGGEDIGGGSGGETTDEKFDSIQDQIDKLLNDIPIGTVRYAYVIPNGWLEMNGQLVNRSDYAELYAWAEENNLLITDSQWNDEYNLDTCNKGKFSYGNGISTFRLPDFRARFIRGLDNNAGIDTNRVLGSEQLPSLISREDNYFNLNETGVDNVCDFTYGWLPARDQRPGYGSWSGDYINDEDIEHYYNYQERTPVDIHSYEYGGRTYTKLEYGMTVDNTSTFKANRINLRLLKNNGPKWVDLNTSEHNTSTYVGSRPRNIALHAIIKAK